MDNTTERGAGFDAKREAYEAARADFFRLIDNPDKSLTIAEYRAQLEAAKNASNDAHEAMLEAWPTDLPQDDQSIVTVTLTEEQAAQLFPVRELDLEVPEEGTKVRVGWKR